MERHENELDKFLEQIHLERYQKQAFYKNYSSVNRMTQSHRRNMKGKATINDRAL